MTKTEKTIVIIIFLWLSWLTYRTLQEPRWQEMVIDLQQKMQRKDDSLDVFKLNHAKIQAYYRQTWVDTLLESLKATPNLEWKTEFEPDTLKTRTLFKEIKVLEGHLR